MCTSVLGSLCPPPKAEQVDSTVIRPPLHGSSALLQHPTDSLAGDVRHKVAQATGSSRSPLTLPRALLDKTKYVG